MHQIGLLLCSRMERQVYETLSSYFAPNGPASPGDEFRIAVLDKLLELKRCELRGYAKDHTLCSISEAKYSDLSYSSDLFHSFAPFINKTFTFGVDFAGAKILCNLRVHLSSSFDSNRYGIVKIQVFEYKPDFQFCSFSQFVKTFQIPLVKK